MILVFGMPYMMDNRKYIALSCSNHGMNT
jgi:hypothetical protein